MLRIVELLVLVTLVSAQTKSSIGKLQQNACSTWYPLGTSGQPLNTLPYTALCSLSPDGTQLIMQIATTSNTGVFTGVVATPVHSNNLGWVEGTFKPTAAGYTALTCNDGSSSVVKDDFSPQTVFSQSWNLPPNAVPSDVKCRFMIAESETVYWNDVILPSVASDGSSSVIGGEQQQIQSDPVASDPFPDLVSSSSGNDTNSTDSGFTTPSRKTTTAILVGNGLETTTTTETPVLPKSEAKYVDGVANNYWCEAWGSLHTLVPGTACSSYHTGIYDYQTNNLKPSGKFECIGGTKFSTINCRCDWINNFLCPSSMK